MKPDMFWDLVDDRRPHAATVYDLHRNRQRCGSCGELWPCPTSQGLEDE